MTPESEMYSQVWDKSCKWNLVNTRLGDDLETPEAKASVVA